MGQNGYWRYNRADWYCYSAFFNSFGKRDKRLSIKQRIINRIEKTEAGKHFIREQRSRIVLFAVFSFFLNLLYAFYHAALGIISHSVWFITMCAYYTVLSTMRLSAALCERKNPSLLLSAIRSISYAEVAASVLTLQRSMLVSFGEMNDTDIHKMNMLTGGVVCLFILILGTAMIIQGTVKKG